MSSELKSSQGLSQRYFWRLHDPDNGLMSGGKHIFLGITSTQTILDELGLS